MSVAYPIIELSTKGQLMTNDEMLKAIEDHFKAQYPADNIGLTFARMYGCLSAYIRREDLETILRHKEIELKESN
jgi:hypothetical protein